MNLKNAVLPLIILNVIMFILQLVLGSSFEGSLILISSDVLARPWILLTSMFLHGGIGHLFFNMYMLMMFGSLLESKIGTKRFLYLYFAAGIAASIAASFFYPRVLGASGAIYGVLGAIAILMPELRVMPLFIPIPLSLWQAMGLFAILDLFVFSGIAVAAHITGAIVGAGYASFMKKKSKSYHEHFSSKVHLEKEDIKEYFNKGRM